MNRYPLWKYILIGIVLIIGLVYTLPNFYGESPAVQVTSGKATVKVTEQTLSQVETALANANLKPNGLFFEQGAQQNTIRVRFDPTQTEEQLRAREVIEKALNSDPKDPSHIVALNLVPNTPQWLLSINALPMYLGLDLRGGVHFLLQVDMRAALTKRADAIAADLRTQLRDKRIRHTGISRIGNDVEVSFATTEERDRANDLLRNTQPDLLLRLPVSRRLGLYSVNESVIIFDRIREHFRMMRRADSMEVVNSAITATISRTVITHTSTLCMTRSQCSSSVALR